MKTIDTLLFDLDGTILDTSTDLANAVNYALEQFGYKKRNLEEIKSYLGNGIENLVKLAMPENSTINVSDILSVFKEYYSNNIHQFTKPYNNIINTLELLKKDGYKIAIVSNKFDDGVQRLCKHFKLYDYAISSVGEMKGIRRKPYADMVNYTLDKISSTYDKSIYIGDSEVDILTAHGSNMKCISVTWGFRDKNDILNIHTDYIANTPQDIINIISMINSI